MTCIEKLKEKHPDWTVDDITNRVDWDCPSDYMDIEDIVPCCPPYNCKDCWEREYDEAVPHEFEFILRNTIVYDAVDRVVDDTKMHMTVLERIKQRYSKETVYRIRRQSEEGWIDENFYTEKEVRKMLEARIDG